MKERLDVLLVEKGLFPSREKAKTAIMAGQVYVNKSISDKPGMTVPIDGDIEIRNTCPYVGRGGLKLEKAINEFKLSLDDVTAMDIGASTGGFTDCMLQHGASKVYAIDVGYGQLDYRLRNDSRVINLEKTNIRYLDLNLITDPIDFASIDVSFISLNLVFPVAASLMRNNGLCVSLIKPQFEAGRHQVGKHGIVKDSKVHMEVIKKVAAYANSAGLYPLDITYSPMKGAKGNIEYLILLIKKEQEEIKDLPINELVTKAHNDLLN